MELKEVKILLKDFGDYVIQQSRSNLTKGNKEYSRKLYNSLDYEISPDAKGLVITFIMEEYGLFQDEGVRGKDPSKVSPNAKITGQQAPNSRFRFGSGNYRGSFEKFAQRMSLFAKSKNIRFRQGKTGKFAKGGYKSMGYVIAKNIYYRGLKPSLFFTKPFEKRFDRLPNNLVTAFVNDIEKNI